MPSLTIDTAAALVLIDLQQGVVGRALQPRSAGEVVRNAALLADVFRTKGWPVVLVHVAFRDQKDRLSPLVDSPMASAPLAPNWADIVPEIGPRPGDIVITKRQWGAFYGTELDLQLRRRGVRTIVLAGIATNFGVESTARDAYERNYEQVFVEDAMTSMSAEGHRFVVENIFPRIGRVATTEATIRATAG